MLSAVSAAIPLRARTSASTFRDDPILRGIPGFRPRSPQNVRTGASAGGEGFSRSTSFSALYRPLRAADAAFWRGPARISYANHICRRLPRRYRTPPAKVVRLAQLGRTADPDDGNHTLEPRQAFTDAAKFLVHLLPKILDLAAVGSALRRAGSHHCQHNLRF